MKSDPNSGFDFDTHFQFEFEYHPLPTFSQQFVDHLKKPLSSDSLREFVDHQIDLAEPF